MNVFPHACFEELVAAFPDVRGRQSLLPVVVPSLAFAESLERGIADRFGICMGCDFVMPGNFVHSVAGIGCASLWTKDMLAWRVLPHWRFFAPRMGVANPGARERFAMARALADRFDQYGHFRPELIRAWSEGRWLKARPMPGEDWQRELFGMLSREIEEEHPALFTARIAVEGELRAAFAAKCPEVLVLGSGSLDPLLIEVLGILADGGTEVTVRMVLPTMDYLGEITRGKSPPPRDMDVAEVAMPECHPLMQAMGRNAVGNFVLLGEMDPDYTHWPEWQNKRPVSGPALMRLQDDLRALRSPATGSAKPDASISIHACFGLRREMECLRDELLRAFEELPGLQPSDVHIVCPDPALYGPYVSAVLVRGEPPLPVRMLEPGIDPDPHGEALLALVAFVAGGRFDAAGVLDLLHLERVQTALEMDAGDVEICRRFVRASGLTHGVGRGGPGSAGSATARLLASRWFEPGTEVRYPGGEAEFVIPVGDPLGGLGAMRDRLVHWIQKLERIFCTWSQTATPREWAARLQSACGNLLGGMEDDPARLALAFLAFLDCQEVLDVHAIRDWLADALETGGRRARFGGHIAFGRFKQLQNLPCRVLAMVGMQDAAFPSRQTPPSWDLLHRSPRIWDRNPRTDDRQLFLDALLAPRDRLVITAPTRNVRNLSTEPFSTCVDELIRTLQAMGAEPVVHHHRLQPFAAEYFDRLSPAPLSYDARMARVAAQLATPAERGPAPFVEEPLPVPPPGDSVWLDDLIRFWKDPAAAFLAACGARPPREEAPDESLSRAVLEPSSLDLWNIKSAIIGSYPEHLDFQKASMQASRALAPGALGTVTWNAARDSVGPMASFLRTQAVETLELQVRLREVLLVGEVLFAGDRTSLLAWRVGKLESPGHFLDVWLRALLASAAGFSLPVLLIDEAHADSPRMAPPIESAEALELLGVLCDGMHAGRSTPLPYAPMASDATAKKMRAGNTDPAEALAAGKKAWLADSSWSQGEGMSAAAQMAWRDRDPFSGPEWLQWAERVAIPLRKWIDLAACRPGHPAFLSGSPAH